jgi:hypothetical protein
MKTVKVPITTLETLIESLADAINVCYNVDSKSERMLNYFILMRQDIVVRQCFRIQEELKNLKESAK